MDRHAINIVRNGETPARTFEDRLKGLEQPPYCRSPASAKAVVKIDEAYVGRKSMLNFLQPVTNLALSTTCPSLASRDSMAGWNS